MPSVREVLRVKCELGRSHVQTAATLGFGHSTVGTDAIYDHCMKTTISLPDEVFASADALARRLGVSRSALYVTAVAEYVAKHSGADVTARLNSVYADSPSGIEPQMRRAQARSVAEDW